MESRSNFIRKWNIGRVIFKPKLKYKIVKCAIIVPGYLIMKPTIIIPKCYENWNVWHIFGKHLL